jgi:hypothetical protein
VVEEKGVVYRLTLSDTSRSKIKTGYVPSIWVEVEIETGMINVQDHSRFNGKDFRNMEYEERREVYDWLTEWEYAAWHRIGYDDTELFATKKLSPDYGVR